MTHLRTGRDEKKGKIQEKMERGSRKRSSSVGSEKMERVGGRYEKMEGHCSTGQSPQWAVVAHSLVCVGSEIRLEISRTPVILGLRFPRYVLSFSRRLLRQHIIAKQVCFLLH